MGDGSIRSWSHVLNNPLAKIPKAAAAELEGILTKLGGPSDPPANIPAEAFPKKAFLNRLLELCPCLYNQIDTPCSARGVVHLCEVTLGTRVTAANVHDAFDIQHPATGNSFSYRPCRPATKGGDVMESLCSEVLNNEGIPLMELGPDDWPVWRMPGHISLNRGQMSSVKAFGDILIPAAPTNIIISVKSEKAKERLLYSANSIEGIAFGFFDDPREFWTVNRMKLYKRMGFTAIYLPETTHRDLMGEIIIKKREKYAVNINGTDLYRPITKFGEDMRSVVGKTTIIL